MFTFSIHPIRTTFADILARDRIAFSGDYSPLDLSLVLIPLSLAVLFSFLERTRDMYLCIPISHCDAALHCNPVVHSFILEDIVKSYFLLVWLNLSFCMIITFILFAMIDDEQVSFDGDDAEVVPGFFSTKILIFLELNYWERNIHRKLYYDIRNRIWYSSEFFLASWTILIYCVGMWEWVHGMSRYVLFDWVCWARGHVTMCFSFLFYFGFCWLGAWNLNYISYEPLSKFITNL